jgi:uncharacterized OsmC-like protein
MSNALKSIDSWSPEAIKALFDRKAEAARTDPESARHSASARVHTAYGLACDVEHEDRRMRVDLPASEGGGATGPHPGQLMRSSLGACLAMGYRIWAARLGVAIDDVSLEIACEYDARGQLGVDAAVPVGWKRVRFDVTIHSAAPEADVRHVVETTQRLSPMLALLSSEVVREFRLRIVNP